jgi:hypothetical protein
MTIEIYKDIVGYEGIYQVSNLGNVKRINKKNLNYLKPFYSNGYYRIGLSQNNVCKKYFIHRLVAQSFIDNPNNLQQVNHINGIKIDNRIENLEWCTPKDNIIHSYKTGLQTQKKGDDSKQSKKIIDIATGEIYNSSLPLSKKIGVSRSTLRKWLNKIPNKTTFRYL